MDVDPDKQQHSVLRIQMNARLPLILLLLPLHQTLSVSPVSRQETGGSSKAGSKRNLVAKCFLLLFC